MPRIVLSFLAVFLCFANPAAAKILYVCGAQALSGNDSALNRDGRLLEPTRISSTPRQALDSGQIALVSDESGYDVVMNYGSRDEESLRSQGADILAMGAGDAFVHLLVSSDGGATTEHFIFAEDHDGLGNLIWGQSPADDAAPSSGSGHLQHEARCVLP
jgi:hypothetical protein